MKIAILVVTKRGEELGKKISSALGEHETVLLAADKHLGEFVGRIFKKYDALVFVMALGIVVRVISEHIKNKKTDPAVVALDEKGSFAISVVSGHHGANNLAKLIAQRIGAVPVVTTASESEKNLCVGIGARKNIDKESVIAAVAHAFDKSGLNPKNIKAVATINSKAREEGILEAAKELGAPLLAIEKSRIKEVESNFERSDYVKRKVGVGCVAEPCAVLAAKNAKLIQKKMKFKGVTIAIAEDLGLGTRRASTKCEARRSAEKGKIFLVGIGPGSKEHMTPKAFDAIKNADVIVGYETYLNFVRDFLAGKEIVSKGMGQEIERARVAVQKAQEGKKVAIVSGGDPGVYAMASVIFEYLKEKSAGIDAEVIPGITAASAAAALLGSPLGHDFAVISMSDLLTPWKVIEKRVAGAARSDFIIVIYNPKSSGRKWQIKKTHRILMKYKKADTPVGIVRNAMREGERVTVTTLEKMLDCEMDMLTTVIVGSSETFVFGDRMITPRGYKSKGRMK